MLYTTLSKCTFEIKTMSGEFIAGLHGLRFKKITVELLKIKNIKIMFAHFLKSPIQLRVLVNFII